MAFSFVGEGIETGEGVLEGSDEGFGVECLDGSVRVEQRVRASR